MSKHLLIQRAQKIERADEGAALLTSPRVQELLTSISQSLAGVFAELLDGGVTIARRTEAAGTNGLRLEMRLMRDPLFCFLPLEFLQLLTETECAEDGGGLSALFQIANRRISRLFVDDPLLRPYGLRIIGWKYGGAEGMEAGLKESIELKVFGVEEEEQSFPLTFLLPRPIVERLGSYARFRKARLFASDLPIRCRLEISSQMDSLLAIEEIALGKRIAVSSLNSVCWSLALLGENGARLSCSAPRLDRSGECRVWECEVQKIEYERRNL